MFTYVVFAWNVVFLHQRIFCHIFLLQRPPLTEKTLITKTICFKVSHICIIYFSCILSFSYLKSTYYRPSPSFQFFVCLFVCLSLCSLFVCFFVSMSVYLFDYFNGCLYVGLSVCLSDVVSGSLALFLW